MLQNVLYATSATALGGRDGRVTTIDGQLDVRVATPKELGGPGGSTNPEQLFAAGYAACFHSALQLVARRAKLDTTGSTVTAEVGLGRAADNPGFALQVDLIVELPELDDASARELVAKADRVCPYSNATRGNIKVEHEVIAGR
jgi:lipoyl-dependent peroxiredoxin